MSGNIRRAVPGGSRLGWPAMWAIIAVALDLRPGIVSIGSVLPAMRADFVLSRAESALLIAIPAFLMGVFAWPVPWLSRTFGRDRVLRAALFLLSVSIVWRSLVSNLAMLILATVCVGAAIAVAGTLIGGFIKVACPGRVAIVTSVYATALSLGSMVSAAATGPLELIVPGWRFATGIWSVLGLLALLAWRGDTQGGWRGHGAEPTVSSPSVSSTGGLPVGKGKAWCVALFLGWVNFLFYALLAWIAPIFQERGYSSALTSMLLAGFMGGFMCANLGSGLISQSLDRRRYLLACAILTFAGIALLGFAPVFAPSVAIISCAAGLGGSFALAMTLPLDNATNPSEADSWNAFAMLIGYTIGALGPLTIGTLRDLTGNYQSSFLTMLIVALLMITMSPMLGPRALDPAQR
jgi:MFS transporter, CP family, cyanate transporter